LLSEDREGDDGSSVVAVRVKADLDAYWKLLRPAGILFGDDYHLRWIGVVRVVHSFADQLGVPLNLSFSDKWLMQNPVGGNANAPTRGQR
jgi:hypothetical protein